MVPLHVSDTCTAPAEHHHSPQPSAQRPVLQRTVQTYLVCTALSVQQQGSRIQGSLCSSKADLTFPALLLWQ